jgi:cellobiose phosphorylase
MERFGHFDEDTGEYVITTPRTSRPQENFLFNERYFACVHQTGNGFSRYTDPRGYATTIVKGGIEPAHNSLSRIIYVRDDDTGDYWCVGWYPVCREPDVYECRQGPGYTVVSNQTDGVAARWRLFVPRGETPVELWTLSLRNTGGRSRRLSVFSVAVLSLESSVGTYGHESYLNTVPLKRAHGVAARKAAFTLPNPYFAALFISGRRPTSWDGDLNTFMDQFRSLANPIGLTRPRCRRSIASRDPVAGILHHAIVLKPGAEWRNDYLAGAADVFHWERDAAEGDRRYLRDGGKSVDRAFAATVSGIRNRLARVAIGTADRRFNRVFNQWIPLLIDWGTTSGRWGMLGYRDIVQQAQGLAMFDPAKSRARLEQALRHQYRDGCAVRSFPAVHEDSKMKYADSSLWLVDAVTEYVKETGDAAFLDEPIPYIDSDQADPVLCHMQRGLDALWNDRGGHGLCRIHQGDWNDSLTHVGRQGRGESVMLSQSFAKACLVMAELHEHRGDRAAAKRCRRRHVAFRENLNRHAWDGAWYVRGFDDDGNPIGSRRCREGKMFVNSQSWALISETAPARRVPVLLRSLRRFLRTPYGYAMLWPTFTSATPNIGRLSCLEPGCSENGSVYTHANAFLAVALAHAGLADEALDVIRRIMPYNPSNPSSSVIPYQLSNGYGGPAHRTEPGKAQFGWSTGSGAWLHQAVVEFLFGARRGYDGLTLHPCLPSSWRNVSLERTYRGCRYLIRYRRHRQGAGGRLIKVTVNGQPHDPAAPLPIEPGCQLDVRAIVG